MSTSGRERYLESLWIERILQRETAGGLIIVGAAVIAVILANSPLGDSYFGLRDTYLSLGAGEFVWKISVGHLTADGLLAVFFFLVGLELKREFVSGELRDPRKAVVPVVAAIGGVIVPASLYLFITQSLGVPEAARGWAIPIATDIAFAAALLAGIGFTVSLLIGELSFGLGTVLGDEAKIGILVGSVLAAVLAAAILSRRNRHYQVIRQRETEDLDGDGIPDIYQDKPETQS
jgi:NhaA family Na+:H+ antiporter